MLLMRFACRGSGKEGECGANGDRYKMNGFSFHRYKLKCLVVSLVHVIWCLDEFAISTKNEAQIMLHRSFHASVTIHERQDHCML